MNLQRRYELVEETRDDGSTGWRIRDTYYGYNYLSWYTTEARGQEVLEKLNKESSPVELQMAFQLAQRKSENQ